LALAGAIGWRKTLRKESPSFCAVKTENAPTIDEGIQDNTWNKDIFDIPVGKHFEQKISKFVQMNRERKESKKLHTLKKLVKKELKKIGRHFLTLLFNS